MLKSLLRRARIRPASWWRRIVFYWLAREGGGLSFFAMLAVPAIALITIVAFAYSGRSRAQQAHLEAQQKRALELQCLAENIYFEARGESLNGQYAIAEVTLNRVRSPYFPKTICGVVHDSRWDQAGRRFVAQFSWTDDEHREPWGPAWQQAMAVATAVSNDAYMPVVPDALYYHATDVHPYWARTKRSVAKIGNHVFYR